MLLEMADKLLYVLCILVMFGWYLGLGYHRSKLRKLLSDITIRD